MQQADRTEILKAWVERRDKAIEEIGVVKHMLKLYAETIKQADKGLRQQQSASIDQMLSELHSMQTLMASIQHTLLEEPPA